jgi:hypothetical protein
MKTIASPIILNREHRVQEITALRSAVISQSTGQEMTGMYDVEGNPIPPGLYHWERIDQIIPVQPTTDEQPCVAASTPAEPTAETLAAIDEVVSGIDCKTIVNVMQMLDRRGAEGCRLRASDVRKVLRSILMDLTTSNSDEIQSMGFICRKVPYGFEAFYSIADAMSEKSSDYLDGNATISVR